MEGEIPTSPKGLYSSPIPTPPCFTPPRQAPPLPNTLLPSPVPPRPWNNIYPFLLLLLIACIAIPIKP
ncbi:hypothetical protein E2C01_077056 [Portunus trituberculatus]|uniref:Uncharacterized protein n=1 Tax=Portunus trituberculatus TaxID=210409 RepID=A0A5B7IDC0_PORTR|nr:hypothetical protein [Portunus trituberculatus]